MKARINFINDAGPHVWVSPGTLVWMPHRLCVCIVLGVEHVLHSDHEWDVVTLLEKGKVSFAYRKYVSDVFPR